MDLHEVQNESHSTSWGSLLIDLHLQEIPNLVKIWDRWTHNSDLKLQQMGKDSKLIKHQSQA